MQAHLVLFLLASLAGSAAARSAENPLGKVLSLMDQLSSKIAAEGDAEEKAFKEYDHWSVEAVRNKGFEIQELTTKQQKLEAQIAKYSADAETAAAKIESLASAIATNEDELKTASTIRAKELGDFQASEKELKEAIDTLGRAHKVIQRESAKNPAMLAQVDSANMKNVLASLSVVVDAAAFSSADKSKLVALVQARQAAEDEDDAPGAPAAAAYKSHSSSILDLLEDLKEKAEEQLSGLRKAESTASHNFAMLKQSLEDQLAADNKDLAEEKSAKAFAEESKATAEGSLASTVKSLDDAKASKATIEQNWAQTKADHEASAAARTQELKVIAEAKDILQSSTGGAVSQSYSLLQVSAGSRAQSHMQSRADLANAEVVTMVKQLAKKHHSAALAQLASQIAAVAKFGAAAGEDPFAKIKGLIADLIARLEKEAGDEATEKAYCDEQLAKTEAKKGELEDSIAKLTAKIDQAAAKSATLKAEVKQLQAELATLLAEQAQMDKIRQETHAAYVQAKADLEAGLTGVRKALSLLRDYYGGAALLQQPAMPAFHSKASGAGSGIIGILEVCEADFAKNLAVEETQEADAASAYEKQTQENRVTKTIKDQDVTYKTQQYTSLDKTITELTSDRSSADNELEAVLEYYAKIKERCIAKPEAYEERVARRSAEINGLREALAVLENETSFAQRRKRPLSSVFLAASK
jgi:hypothetical protein